MGIWEKAEEIRDPELAKLAAALPLVLRSSLAEGTNKKYERGWKGWRDWANQAGAVPCPGDPFFFCLYMTSLIFTNGTKGALIDAFYGIRWGHHTAGYESPTENPTVKMSFEGAQRICAKPVTKKDPMLAGMVRELVDNYGDKSRFSLHDLRFLLVVVICYAGFLRIDELLCTKLKNITIKPSHMEIFLEECKNDKAREGSTVMIARTGTRYCPVGMVEKYLQHADLDLRKNGEAHLICRLVAIKNGVKAHATRGIGYTRVREVFKDYVAPLESQGYNLGLHSMRAGGATTASENDIGGDLMDIHGRWKSEKSKKGYIKHSLKKRLSVTQSLGL